MTILDIYSKYQIMPNLQTHMLRVAGVGKIIAEDLCDQGEVENIIRTTLLHDMGNILKFDLTQFPKFLEPQGLDYWQGVKDQYRQKYGPDEHQASLQIAQEIGVSQRVLELIESINFSKAKENVVSMDLAKMICGYADDRVAPDGVVSLEERIADLEKRYGQKYSSPEDKQRRKEFAEYTRSIEKRIFDSSSLKPDQINDTLVESQFDQLKRYEFTV
jgi:hypothetical protein